MKQGSTDDPFAEEPDDGDTERDGTDDSRSEPTESERESATASSGSSKAEDGGIGSAGDRSSAAGGAQRGTLPYIHARDGVKDGRTQRPVFLRDHVEVGIDELVAEMESEFGEDVYKTDVTEAAMAVAQEHPDLVREKLESWGYGWS